MFYYDIDNQLLKFAVIISKTKSTKKYKKRLDNLIQP